MGFNSGFKGLIMRGALPPVRYVTMKMCFIKVSDNCTFTLTSFPLILQTVRQWSRSRSNVIGAGLSGFERRYGQEIFLPYKTSRQALGTQPAPSSMGARVLSREQRSRDVKLNTYLHPVPSICLHGVQTENFIQISVA